MKSNVPSVLLLAALALGNSVSASDAQIRFDIQQPFRVGAHVFDAGVISMHSVSAYTPTTSIFEVWVNGTCLGMVSAHRTKSEADATRTQALFRRDANGPLEMVGFQVTGRPRGTTYRFPEPTMAAALSSAQTDFPSAISPLTARRTASESGSDSTISASSGWRSARVGARSSAK